MKSTKKQSKNSLSTSYTMEYSGKESEKLTMALRDCQNYLGRDYKRVTGILAGSSNKFEFEFGCMMSGIQGYYPVKALAIALELDQIVKEFDEVTKENKKQS